MRVERCARGWQGRARSRRQGRAARLEAPAGLLLGLVLPARGVLLHLALGVVLLVHRAGVVGAVHGLALHAPVVLLLLQAAPDVLLLPQPTGHHLAHLPRLLRGVGLANERARITVVAGALLVLDGKALVAPGARVLLAEEGERNGEDGELHRYSCTQWVHEHRSLEPK